MIKTPSSIQWSKLHVLHMEVPTIARHKLAIMIRLQREVFRSQHLCQHRNLHNLLQRPPNNLLPALKNLTSKYKNMKEM